MAYKLYNPDAHAITLVVRGATIVIPSAGYAVIDTSKVAVEHEVQSVYPALEVTWVDDSELAAYRAKLAKLQKEAEERAAAAAKAAEKAAKEEAKLVEERIAARHAAEKKARDHAAKEKLALIEGEAAAHEEAEKTIVVNQQYQPVAAVEPPKKRGRKPKQ